MKKFIKKNWRYILLFGLIGGITQVILEEIPYQNVWDTTWADEYWFLTFVIPTLVLLAVTWKKK